MGVTLLNIPTDYGRFNALGIAANGTATSFTLPASSARYLVLVAHNSTPQSNGLYMVSTDGNAAHKLSSSGSNLTVTCSGTTLTVKSSSGTVGVYYMRV